jgi:hypothetical protein
MENGEWRMENGEWRMENGEWRMENGEWRMENGTEDICMSCAKEHEKITRIDKSG